MEENRLESVWLERDLDFCRCYVKLEIRERGRTNIKIDSWFEDFGTSNGYRAITKSEDCVDGNTWGRARDLASILPEKIDSRTAVYQTAKEYAKRIAKENNVPLKEKRPRR